VQLGLDAEDPILPTDIVKSISESIDA